MKFQGVMIIGLCLATSGCAYYPTNGNDTTFTRTGTLDCAENPEIDPGLLAGSEERPVRCGPQAQTLDE